MKQWFKEWPQRLEREKYEMGKCFPELGLHHLDNGNLAWTGPIRLPSGRVFNIAIVYPENFPVSSPRVYPIIDTEIPKGVSHIPHRFSDGSLCISYPTFDSPSATAADVAMLAALWLMSFESYIETGKWEDLSTISIQKSRGRRLTNQEQQNPSGIEFNQKGALSEEMSQDKSGDIMGEISILFVSADPTDASRLRLGEEFREIHEKLKLAQLRDRFKLELPQMSVRPADISQVLLDIQPQIVHFSGHGTSTGALCFESQTGQSQLVQPDALAALFEQFASQVNCILLNACYSEIQAKAIAEHIEYVIGMNKAIGDKAAIAFAIGFYQALGAGRTVEEAYKLGCVQIMLQSIPEHLTPVLIKKGQ